MQDALGRDEFSRLEAQGWILRAVGDGFSRPGCPRDAGLDSPGTQGCSGHCPGSVPPCPDATRARWERFRALTERKKAALTAALNIQNFRLECHETRGWMREKTAAIEATRALGRDLAGITALQGKLSGMGRDLDAIQGKLRELRAEGEKLQGEQPERAAEIREGLAGLEAEWDSLRVGLRSREESLGQARRLQGFLRDLAALQAWLSRTRAAAGSEDVPASLAEAEGSLRQHESLRTEISHYGADYRSARAAGREVTRGQTDPQSLSLLQRLETLDADWEELGRLWEKRQRLLAQAVAFHVFLRDAKQVEGTLGKQVRGEPGSAGESRGSGAIPVPIPVPVPMLIPILIPVSILIPIPIPVPTLSRPRSRSQS